MSLNIGYGLIKKNTTFSGSQVEERNSFQDYMSVLKGISNDLIAPVMELRIERRYFNKVLERRQIVTGSSAGRVNLGEYIQK